MLKTLAMLAILAGFTIGNSGKKDDRPNLTKNNGSNESTPTFSVINNQACPPNAEAAETKPPHWYTSPEWWLCILGVPTLGFIGWQAKATADAARATKESADATLQNANALANAERGRLVVVYSTPEPDSPEAGIFEFKIKNIGRCPALLKFARLRVLFLTRGHDLPKEPQGLEEERYFSPYQEEWILTGDSTPLLVVDALETLDLSGKGLLAPPEKIYDMRGGDLDAWVYGRMRYFDGITPLETTSGFCYKVLCDEGGAQWLLREGPAAYWKETSQHPQNQKAN